MNKKKIYHIHTDFKFLYDSYRFESDMFENQLVFIGEKNDSNTDYHSSALFFSGNDNSVDSLIKTLEDADLVVFYALCDKKIKVLEKLPTQIKTAWRFFGYELYGSRHDLMYSKKTIEILYKKKSYYFSLFFGLNFFYKNIRRRIRSAKDLEYMKKIDFILLFAEEEYIYLKKHWKVPEFLKLNLDEFLTEDNFSNADNKVIVGNSRNSFNNHLDIIDLISNHHSSSEFLFFLNYGSKGRYYLEVMNRIQKLSNCIVYDEFLGKQEFEQIYSTSSAFVLNSHRQMALGNIFLAVKYGLKLYMNDKNPLKQWLINNNILVSSIEDFEDDLKREKLSLSLQDKKNNIQSFNNLYVSYTKTDFCDQVQNILSK